MNSRKRSPQISTQTKIRNVLIGAGSLTLTALQSVQAQDEEPVERMVRFADATGQTGYEFKTAHTSFSEPFKQIANGACGVLTNITSTPVHLDIIQTLQDNFGTLSRGVGQLAQNGTEECLKLMLPKDVENHLQKTESHGQEKVILFFEVVIAALAVSAAIGLTLTLMMVMKHYYLRWSAPLAPQQTIPADDQIPLLDDIEQPAIPAAPSEPAREIKTVAERWEAIEKAAKVQKKQITLLTSFVCPITLSILENPVCDVNGHTYEKQAIEDWFKNSSKSPVAGIPIRSKVLVGNYALKSAIGEFLQTCEKELNLTVYKEELETANTEVSENNDEIFNPEKESSFEMRRFK